MRATLLALIFTLGCAVRSTPDVPEPVLARPSLQLFTPFGFGHGCPVMGLIFTARHLVQHPPDDKPTGVTFRASNGDVYAGRTIGTSWAADIAMIHPGNAPLEFYRLGEEPQTGDIVYWWEYEPNPGPNVMRAKLRGERVLRAPAGHLVLADSPVPGASGSCALNAEGEVVGIVVWGNPLTRFAIIAPIAIKE